MPYATRNQRRSIRPTLEALEERACPATYTITDLLPYGAGTSSSALAMNDNGLIAGRGTISTTDSHVYPLAWRAAVADKTASAIFLPGVDTGAYGFAHDVNNLELIVGESYSSNSNHAVVWTPTGAAFAVHELTPQTGYANSVAFGTSEPDAFARSWVVGYSQNGGGESRPMVWQVNAAGAVMDSFVLEASMVGKANDAIVIGNTVRVFGEAELSATTVHATQWEFTLNASGDVLRDASNNRILTRLDLGTLGGRISYAYAGNTSGAVVGKSRIDSGTIDYAFSYQNGVMTNLGTFTNHGSYAADVNNAGVIVGSCLEKGKWMGAWYNHAFVYQNNKMTKMADLISGKARWTLQNAFDINESGHIVGVGNSSSKPGGQSHGYVAWASAALEATMVGPRNASEFLDLEQVAPLADAATMRWQAAGIDVASLAAITIQVADLPGTTLGLVAGNTIWLDINAAGWGWFIDPTPWDDSEFATPGEQGELNRMDLLTVLMHEYGHALGLDHADDGVMAETLDDGIRRTPEPLADALRGADLIAVWESLTHESGKRR
jgi:probable HAF family extracellular repeat protein